MEHSNVKKTGIRHTHNLSNPSMAPTMDKQGLLVDIQKSSSSPVEFSRAISRFVGASSKVPTKGLQGVEDMQSKSHTPIEFSRAISRFVASRTSVPANAYEQMNMTDLAEYIVPCQDDAQPIETMGTPFHVDKLSNQVAQVTMPQDFRNRLHKSEDAPESARPPLSPKQQTRSKWNRVCPNLNTSKTTENKVLHDVMENSHHERGLRPRSESSISVRTDVTDPLTLCSASWDSPTSSNPSIRLAADDREKLPPLLENLPSQIGSEDDISVERHIEKKMAQTQTMVEENKEGFFSLAKPSSDQTEESEETSEHGINGVAIGRDHFLQLHIIPSDQPCATSRGPRLLEPEVRIENILVCTPKLKAEDSVRHEKQHTGLVLHNVSKVPEVISQDPMERKNSARLVTELALPSLCNTTREAPISLGRESESQPPHSGDKDYSSGAHGNQDDTKGIKQLSLPRLANQEFFANPDIQGREGNRDLSEGGPEPGALVLLSRETSTYASNFSTKPSPFQISQSKEFSSVYKNEFCAPTQPSSVHATEKGATCTDKWIVEDREQSSRIEYSGSTEGSRERLHSAEQAFESELLFSADDNDTTCASPSPPNIQENKTVHDSPHVHFQLPSETKEPKLCDGSLSEMTAPTEPTFPAASWDTISTLRSLVVGVTLVNTQEMPPLTSVQETPKKSSSRTGLKFFSRTTSSPSNVRRDKHDVRTPKMGNRSRRRRKVHKISPKSKKKVLASKIDAFFANTIPLIQERSKDRPINMTYSFSTEDNSPPKEIIVRIDPKARLHELYWDESKKKRQDRLRIVSEYRSRRHGRRQVNKILLKADHAAERRMKTRHSSHKERRTQLTHLKENLRTVKNECSTRTKRRPPSGRTPMRTSAETHCHSSGSNHSGHHRRRSSSRSRADEQRRLSTFSETTIKAGQHRRRSSSRSRASETNAAAIEQIAAKATVETRRRSSSSRARRDKKTISPKRGSRSDGTDKHRKRSSSHSSSGARKNTNKPQKTRSSASSSSGEKKMQRRRSSGRLSLTEDDSTKPANSIVLTTEKLRSLPSQNLLFLTNSSDDDDGEASDATPPQAFGIVRTFSFFGESE